MKTLRIVSIILISLGFLLSLAGFLFKIQHWPDIFKGIFSGPIFIIVGTILFIVSLKKK